MERFLWLKAVPSMLVTRPPASSRIMRPAATSQILRPNSQEPSIWPAATKQRSSAAEPKRRAPYDLRVMWRKIGMFKSILSGWKPVTNEPMAKSEVFETLILCGFRSDFGACGPATLYAPWPFSAQKVSFKYGA